MPHGRGRPAAGGSKRKRGAGCVVVDAADVGIWGENDDADDDGVVRVEAETVPQDRGQHAAPPVQGSARPSRKKAKTPAVPVAPTEYEQQRLANIRAK